MPFRGIVRLRGERRVDVCHRLAVLIVSMHTSVLLFSTVKQLSDAICRTWIVSVWLQMDFSSIEPTYMRSKRSEELLIAERQVNLCDVEHARNGEFIRARVSFDSWSVY